MNGLACLCRQVFPRVDSRAYGFGTVMGLHHVWIIITGHTFPSLARTLALPVACHSCQRQQQEAAVVVAEVVTGEGVY